MPEENEVAEPDVNQALRSFGARLDALEADLDKFKRDVRESVTIRERDAEAR